MSRRRKKPSSPRGGTDPFAPFAKELRAYAAAAYRQHDRDPLWSEESEASNDARHASDRSEWHAAAVHEAQMLPFMLLVVIEDHLAGLAATLLAKKTVIASVSLLRPILEASARCHYLVEPGLGFEERARRGLNLRLQQAVETLNIASDPEDRSGAAGRVRTQAQHKLEDLIAGASANGYTVCSGRPDRLPAGIEPPRWVDPRVPSAQQLLEEIFVGDSIAPFFHRFTSGVLHAQTHALLPFIVGAERVRTPSGDYSVPFGMSGRAMAPLLAGPVFAIYHLIESAAAYYGWPPEQWRTEGLPTLVRWRQWMGT